MVDFKKEIAFGNNNSRAGKKSGSYPTKTKINLVNAGLARENRVVTIVLFVVFIVLLAIFAKFAIADPLTSIGASNERVHAAQAELDDLKQQNSSMSELGDQYAKYVVSGMTDEESELINRNEVIDLLRTKVMGVSVLSSVKISDNKVTITCQGLSLQDASVVVRDLEQDKRVSHVTVSTAQEKDGSIASATFEIKLKTSSELAEQKAGEQKGTLTWQESAQKGAEDGE